MSETVAFCDLLRRLRDKTPGAVEEFLRLYGEEVRVLAHLKCLRYRYARPDLDSEEVHQSVIASFCVRVRLGKFENLDTPEGLKKLLHRMVANKVVDRMRKVGGSVTRLGGDSLRTCQIAAPPESPSQHLEIEELLRKAQQLLSAEEWDLVERRRAGESWEEIGRAHDDSPEAVRKRHDRAVKRALHLLLGEED